MSVLEYSNGELTGTKIAGFDLDDTLVEKSSLKPFPGVCDKLNELVKNGYNIVIVSNQKKRSIGDPKLLIKLKKVADVLTVPFLCYCAREDDENRKPKNGILNMIPKKYGKMEFFVGDAAGRPGDHSDCDLLFAKNSNIPFYTPEEYFNKKEEKDEIKEHMIRELPESLKSINGVSILTMIIMIGYPGAGKSTYSQTTLKDYFRINKDEMKTKCVKICREQLSLGNSVVIDNTNGSKKARKEYIDLANTYGAVCVAIHINTSMEKSLSWNNNRVTNGTIRKVPKIAYYTYRKNFEKPLLDEGFDAIYTIDDEFDEIYN